MYALRLGPRLGDVAVLRTAEARMQNLNWEAINDATDDYSHRANWFACKLLIIMNVGNDDRDAAQAVGG